MTFLNYYSNNCLKYVLSFRLINVFKKVDQSVTSVTVHIRLFAISPNVYIFLSLCYENCRVQYFMLSLSTTHLISYT